MARSPAEPKSADEIIELLNALDVANLGRLITAAQALYAVKQQAERDAFVARVRKEAKALGYAPEELFQPATLERKALAGRKQVRGKVAAQFRSPDGQSLWSGRGRSPKWLAALESQGRSREDFRIQNAQPDLIEQSG
jgi:DNA-binding protein H-NS